MVNVEIFEQFIQNPNGSPGKIAVFRISPNIEKPKPLMDQAVSEYVGFNPYNEFIEIFLDNPWVRVIVSDIDSLNFVPFKDQKIS